MLSNHRLRDPEREARLHLSVGLAQRARGDLGADQHLTSSLTFAIEHSVSDLTVDALVALATQGRVTTLDGATFIEAAEQARTMDLSAASRARLLAAISTAYAISEHQPEGRLAYQEAIDIVQDLPDSERDAKIEVYLRAHLGCPLPEDFGQRDDATAELDRLAGSDPDLLWEAAFLAFGAAMARNNHEAAAASFAELRELQPRISTG